MGYIRIFCELEVPLTMKRVQILSWWNRGKQWRKTWSLWLVKLKNVVLSVLILVLELGVQVDLMEYPLAIPIPIFLSHIAVVMGLVRLLETSAQHMVPVLLGGATTSVTAKM